MKFCTSAGTLQRSAQPCRGAGCPCQWRGNRVPHHPHGDPERGVQDVDPPAERAPGAQYEQIADVAMVARHLGGAGTLCYFSFDFTVKITHHMV